MFLTSNLFLPTRVFVNANVSALLIFCIFLKCVDRNLTSPLSLLLLN